MSTAVHQFVPALEPGAVGAHALEIRRTLRQTLGQRSELFAGEIHRACVGQARPYRDYGAAVPAATSDALIYHLAVGSDIADFVVRQHRTLIVNYHNLTPARLLGSWDPDAFVAVEWGRRQLADLAASTQLAVADSAFNMAELVGAGYRRVEVVPILVDLEAMGAAAGDRDGGLGRRLSTLKEDGGADWLFVGRLAPNKAQHEVIKAFALYRRCYDPRARLWLVGGSPLSSYRVALEHLVTALGLGECVTLTGSVSQAALVSYYRAADVFVCLSQHEGFCVPLLEAMWHAVPVVALVSSAVPETLGPAGVLLPSRPGGGPAGSALVAAAVHRVLDDRSLRGALIAAGRARAQDFSLDGSRRRFLEAITSVVGEI